LGHNPQTFEQFLDRESCCPGTRDCIGDDLAELPLTFIAGARELLFADEGSGTLVRFEQAVVLEFAVGANHRVGINLEVDRELPHGGELIARIERTGRDRPAGLVDNLAVNRDAGVKIEVKPEREFWPGVHMY